MKAAKSAVYQLGNWARTNDDVVQYRMSEIDVKALETNFAKWRQDRAPEEKESDAFEVYSIEQVLKDSDLSDDEINFGRFGGADDGGVDGMYLFINRALILDETVVPESAIAVDLVIVQAKQDSKRARPSTQPKENDAKQISNRRIYSIAAGASQRRQLKERFWPNPALECRIFYGLMDFVGFIPC